MFIAKASFLFCVLFVDLLGVDLTQLCADRGDDEHRDQRDDHADIAQDRIALADERNDTEAGNGDAGSEVDNAGDQIPGAFGTRPYPDRAC